MKKKNLSPEERDQIERSKEKEVSEDPYGSRESKGKEVEKMSPEKAAKRREERKEGEEALLKGTKKSGF